MALAPAGERRSLGLKFLLVCALVLLLMAPALLVQGLVSERVGRADAVIAEVGETFGGPQSFVGPVLVAPYTITRTVPATATTPAQEQVERGWYAVFAETGTGVAEIDVDTRTRGEGGLFKVRTYVADVTFRATFDLTEEPVAAPANAQIDWSRAAFMLGVADTRGAKEARITIGDSAPLALAPGTAYAGVFPSDMGVRWLAADAGPAVRPGSTVPVSAKLGFSGVESVSLVAFAKETEIRMRGDWAEVGHFGAFPRNAPGASDTATAAKGFDARWSIPYVARGYADAGDAASFAGFTGAAVETRLLDPANPYRAVERALKYALMFVGVVFLAYFLMEATSERRVHPAQYLLVGLAQVIFYLLLLSIAERVGFDLAFLVSASATVLLIGAYAGAAFRSAGRGAVATAAFAVLYALIYLLMRAEDYALLAGSIAAFVAIAAVMIFTRNLDWYGLAAPTSPLRRPSAPSGDGGAGSPS